MCCDLRCCVLLCLLGRLGGGVTSQMMHCIHMSKRTAVSQATKPCAGGWGAPVSTPEVWLKRAEEQHPQFQGGPASTEPGGSSLHPPPPGHPPWSASLFDRHSDSLGSTIGPSGLPYQQGWPRGVAGVTLLLLPLPPDITGVCT